MAVHSQNTVQVKFILSQLSSPQPYVRCANIGEQQAPTENRESGQHIESELVPLPLKPIPQTRTVTQVPGYGSVTFPEDMSTIIIQVGQQLLILRSYIITNVIDDHY